MKHLSDDAVSALLVGSLPVSFRNFRGALIASIKEAGCEVHAVAPDLTQEGSTHDWLSDRGVYCHDVFLSRTGLSPWGDLRTLWQLIRIMRGAKPDYFLGYTIKPVIWGLIAAWISKVPNRVALITGLGYAFTGEVRGERALIQKVARGLYRFALGRSTLIFFQNPDDRAEFDSLGLLPPGVPVVVVNGSGVDIQSFVPAEFPPPPLRFLLIARLLGDKGIREYVAAARRVRAIHPDVEFHLVGGLDTNPDAISEAEVQAWHEDGIIVWHGALADVRPAISSAHVYVLPSYREGTPRTVLEAMAMGRPIITSDAPGCRETVIDGENGFLVPVCSVDALVDALMRFIEEPALIRKMGACARQIAEEKYDVHKVNSAMLRAMGLYDKETD